MYRAKLLQLRQVAKEIFKLGRAISGQQPLCKCFPMDFGLVFLEELIPHLRLSFQMERCKGYTIFFLSIMEIKELSDSTQPACWVLASIKSRKIELDKSRDVSSLIVWGASPCGSSSTIVAIHREMVEAFVHVHHQLSKLSEKSFLAILQRTHLFFQLNHALIPHAWLWYQIVRFLPKFFSLDSSLPSRPLLLLSFTNFDG